MTIHYRKQFDDLLHQAAQLLAQAEQVAILGGLSDIEKQQAHAANQIAGVDFYGIKQPAWPADFERLNVDLRYIATVVDPLILAIGKEAKANSNAITDADVSGHFKDVIWNAIDGNALHCLEQAAQVRLVYDKLTSEDKADAAADRAHDARGDDEA